MPRKLTTPDKQQAKGGEIVLRLGGTLIAPEEFRKAVNAFVDMLLSVSDDIAQGGKKPLWNISVRKGSAILAARAMPDNETSRTARATIRAVKSGVAKLERGHSDVTHFTPKAMAAAQMLSSVRAKPSRVGITVVEITTGDGKPCEVTPKTAETVHKTMGVQHQAYSSIEGKLSTISERGHFQFVVWDSLSDLAVNCFIPEKQFEEATAAFRKRVCVSGMVQYGSSGRPVSIKVDKIKVFRDDSEIPSLDHFYGLLSRP